MSGEGPGAVLSHRIAWATRTSQKVFRPLAMTTTNGFFLECQALGAQERLRAVVLGSHQGTVGNVGSFVLLFNCRKAARPSAFSVFTQR